MTTLKSADLAQFLSEAAQTPPSKSLTIVGVLKAASATHIQFSGDNFASWLNLPISLIEEATHLGTAESSDPDSKDQHALFSIALKVPNGEAEQFLFELLRQTTRALSLFRQATTASSPCSCDKPASMSPAVLAGAKGDIHPMSGCYACSTQYRCYRQCWDANGNWYWRYDPACC